VPVIRPVSDLSNYEEVLRDVSIGSPVFLTEDGHGRYVIVDMEEYSEYEVLLEKQKLLTQNRNDGTQSQEKTD